MGEQWSVAWRVLDAQFWGTSDKPLPQRRRRIALVADFGGLSAPEILFVRKSVSGNTEPGESKRKEAPGNAGEGAGGAVPCTLKIRGGCSGGGKGALIQTDKSATLSTLQDQTLFQPVTYQRRTGPLMANSHPESYTGQDAFSDMLIAGYAAGGYGNYTEGVGTLRASGGDYGGGTETLIRCQHIVRRLTPLECERLQGFPDGWTDIGEWVDSKGKKHKEADSPRYKALGNSIAIPPWKWVLKRLCACYERDATMASLFDGIGGFPYIWEQLNGKGSCLWSSEIEEFPMAVTKLRFGG